MVVIAVATVCPWYIATTVGGSATLAGWGAWTAAGDLNASLRPLPLAVLAYLPAGFMIVSALRDRFGAALIGAMATVAAAILPFMTEALVDRRLPGGESVAVDVGPAPVLVLAFALVVFVVCWIGYARRVLRAAPRAETA
ncbi:MULTISPECIES: hypothetical protein [unclassified Mycobacterium]|uniref:hypothetical protein n=1 Tax=unclassified Mycobacterium TaxID=2642494 RepID=UPI0029C73B17|nr:MULTISPECIES: hypothetical protein [unclassified Mycobacterium]